MEKAAVLVGGTVVKTTYFQRKYFSYEGFLTAFYLGDISYRHFDREQFLSMDSDLYSGRGRGGYYNETVFLAYKSRKQGSPSIVDVFKSEFRSSDFLATTGDKIQVTRLYIAAPYNYFYSIATFEFSFVLGSRVVDDATGKSILIPPGTTPSISQIQGNQSDAVTFYNNRKGLIDLFQSGEKDAAATLITKAALVINQINRDIFSLFNLAGPDGPQQHSFVVCQNESWQLGNIFGDLSLNSLQFFYLKLDNFYRSAYENLNLLIDSEGDERQYWLVRGMAPEALSLLDPFEKIRLLSFMVRKRLSTAFEKEIDEELVVRTINAFTASTISEVDDFMDLMVSTYPLEDSKTTLFQALYDRMSTSTNFKEGLLGISNWVFGTNFQPTTTKGKFIKTMYSLWTFSKYNPYNDDGTIKPNTLAFKMTGSGVAQFSSVNTDNYLFHYTHDVAYRERDSQSETPVYSIDYPEAAPMVIPYESEKSFGIFLDNFNFGFKGDKIIAYRRLKHTVILLSDNSDVKRETNEVQFGNYQIYQPVSLLNTNIDTSVSLVKVDGNDVTVNGQNVNSFVPVFALKFVDDDGDSKDAETMLGYILDVATTFSGIGNLAKLRHLRWAAAGAETVGLFTLEGLQLVIGGVEFTSGVLSFLYGFVECGEDDDFCREMKTFLSILDIATLSADGITTLLAKRQARRLLHTVSDSTDPVEIQAALVARLGDSEHSEEAAHVILQFSDEASVLESFAEMSGRIREIVVAKIKKALELAPENKFALTYSLAEIQHITEHLSTKVNFLGEAFHKLCADFIFTGSRVKKRITSVELVKQITFYYDVVQKRGFTSGFNNIDHFRAFCVKTRNHFSVTIKFWDDDLLTTVFEELQTRDPDLADHLMDYWMEDFDFSKRFELIVQGSANRKFLPGDPIPNGIPLPDGQPGDFEFAFRTKPKDYEVFTLITKEYFRRSGNVIDENAFLSKGFLNSKDVKSIYGDQLFNNYLDHLDSDDINFILPGPNAKKPISFAILCSGKPYDNQPFTTFKY